MLPSRFLAPLVPLARVAVPGRVKPLFDRQSARALAVADAVAIGDDEAARAQRMALFAFAVRIFSAVIAYGSQVYLARVMGAYEYGIFVLVWVTAVICGGIACLGYPSAVVRFVPRYLFQNDHEGVRGIVFGARAMAFATASALAAFAGLVLWLLGDRVESIYVWPFALGLVCLPMLSLGDVQDGISRAFSFKGLALTPTFILRPTLILLFMVVALELDYRACAQTALGASIFACWVSALVQFVFLNRAIAARVEKGARAIRVRTWMTVALPIFLVEGFFQLLTNVDILMVGRYMEPSEVAVYFAAVKTLALVHFVYFAVKAGSAQRYSHYHSAGDQEAYSLFVAQTVKWTFWPSLLMSAAVLLAAPMLLSLFGEGFARGAPLLFVLVVGIVARATVGPAEAVLTMSGQQNACAVAYGVTLLVNIGLNASLIPVYGLMGAAIATTCALCFEAAALYALVLRRLGLRMFVLHAHRRTALAANGAAA